MARGDRPGSCASSSLSAASPLDNTTLRKSTVITSLRTLSARSRGMNRRFRANSPRRIRFLNLPGNRGRATLLCHVQFGQKTTEFMEMPEVRPRIRAKICLSRLRPIHRRRLSKRKEPRRRCSLQQAGGTHARNRLSYTFRGQDPGQFSCAIELHDGFRLWTANRRLFIFATSPSSAVRAQNNGRFDASPRSPFSNQRFINP
jgi:hypothetical protein